MLTSKNVIFNERSFANYEIAIEFVALKRVQEWSRILYLSLNWPYMQNETILTHIFHNFFQKMLLFVNDFKNRRIIYCWKAFFTTNMNSRSFPKNKALFGSNQLIKFPFVGKCVPIIRSLLSENKHTIVKRSSCWSSNHP